MLILCYAKPEPNMLKTLPIIPSQHSSIKLTIILILFTYYSYFILFVLCIDIQRNMDLVHNFAVAIV